MVLYHTLFIVHLQKNITYMRIKQIIKQKKLTTSEVAKRMGIAQSSFSRVMNANPTVEMLYRVAEALDVDVRDLFDIPNNRRIYGIIAWGDMPYKIDGYNDLKRLVEDIELYYDK